MISQIVAFLLSGASAIQDYRTQEIDGRLVLVIVASSTITQLLLGFDNLIGVFGLLVFISLWLMERLSYVGKADVLIVPAIVVLNPFWDNVLVFAFGCSIPLGMALLSKQRQPMLLYLFLAQFAVIALRALNAGRLI